VKGKCLKKREANEYHIELLLLSFEEYPSCCQLGKYSEFMVQRVTESWAFLGKHLQTLVCTTKVVLNNCLPHIAEDWR
jgi:hypothetical protein